MRFLVLFTTDHFLLHSRDVCPFILNTRFSHWHEFPIFIAWETVGQECGKFDEYPSFDILTPSESLQIVFSYFLIFLEFLIILWEVRNSNAKFSARASPSEELYHFRYCSQKNTVSLKIWNGEKFLRARTPKYRNTKIFKGWEVRSHHNLSTKHQLGREQPNMQ